MSYFYLDIPIARFFSQYQERFRWLCDFVYNFFIGKYFLPLIILLLIASYIIQPLRRFRYWLFALLLCLVVGQVFLVMLKPFVGRARPYMVMETGHFLFKPFSTNHDYLSFPSGHTINIMMLFGLLGLRYPNHQKAWICLGLAISFVRVINCEHFLSDCMFSAYSSLLLMTGTYYVLQRPVLKSYSWIQLIAKGFEEKPCH